MAEMKNKTVDHHHTTSWSLKEYTYLRLEVIERVKILHGIISIAVLLYLPILIAWLWLMLQGAPQEVVDLFLLCIPIIYAGLLFNYQANQMTLEQVSNYLTKLINTSASADRATVSWDDFYGQRKERYRMTSFLKVTPLLFPLLIPLVVLILHRGAQEKTAQSLLILDLLLLLLALINFRYKISGFVSLHF